MKARGGIGWGALFGLACIALALTLGPDHAWAQKSTPFGVSRPEETLTGSPNVVLVWILTKTAQYYQQLVEALKESRQNGMATWGLILLSFFYGVFHAAGPGHGKAVISAYLFANTEAVKKGVFLSFAFALVQALSAILLVSILAGFLNATARTMDSSTLALERLSSFMVMAIGAWLFWRKGGALWSLVAARFGLKAQPVHVHDGACGHLVLPPEGDNARRNNVRAILLSGLRPCTGALIVLVFAWRQGIFGSGIAATFAMALGTACTITAIAIIAVLAKGLAVRLAAPDSFGAAVAVRTLELGMAFMVFSLGLVMLLGAVTLPGM